MNKFKYDFSLSVVIAVYNDEEVLRELYRRLHAVLSDLSPNYEIIFVDDGSSDSSINVLKELQSMDDKIIIVKLTRNFGQANAISAGLENSSNDVIVLMDSDLQDRPEDIPKLLAAMIEYDVPMAVTRWISRKDNSFRVMTSRFFQSISNKITNLHILPGLGVFRVMKREIVEEIKELKDSTAPVLSLINWMGYDYTYVELNRDNRYAGSSGYTISKMVKLALDRIFSYSLFPIQLAIILGLTLGLSSILLALYLVFQRLIIKILVPGWTSIIVAILFLFGINFIFLGILGEYLGRTYIEAKRRPKYVISKIFKK